MKKQLVTINLKKVNYISYAMLIVPFIFAVLLKFLVFKKISYGVGYWDYLIIILGMPILFVCHECVHALFFMIGGAPKKSIKFGAIPKKMMLYCTTNEPINKKAYAIALIMPLIITGVLPLIVAIILLDWKYIFLFAGMISGAAGDVVMIIKLLKYKTAKMVLDHPKAPAFYLLYDENDLPNDFVEVTEEMEQKLLEEIGVK